MIHPDILAVKERLKEIAISESPPLREILEDLLLRDGKFLRAGFCIISGRFGEADSDSLHKMAAALEIFHLATLIHDDIIDNGRQRRGKWAAHRLYGMRKTVLSGDYLYSRAFLLITDVLENSDITNAASALGHICRQEMLQSLDRSRVNPGKRAYLRRIAGKTALLFLLSFFTGIRVSDHSDRYGEAFRRIGYNFGMAFQIIDDILDFLGDANRTGKTAMQDIKNDVVTLPVILASANAGKPRGRITIPGVRIAPRRGLKAWVERHHGFDAARRVAEEYTHRVFQEISRLPSGPYRSYLTDAVTTCLHREY